MEESTASSKLEGNIQNKRYNYIVGIDFGTYSTSFSFAHVDYEGDIQTITDWKYTKKSDFGGRVASSIIYKEQDSLPLWGGAAHKKFYNENTDYFYVPHIKLYLTDAENQTALPENLNTIKLLSDYLEPLHEYCINRMEDYFQEKNQENEVEGVEVASHERSLNKKINKANFNFTKDQIRYVFSYPDNQEGRGYTDILKKALEAAEIIGPDDPEHRLRFIPESRATAYFCSNMPDQILKPSKKPYLVCDIGGEVFGLSTIKAEELSETGTVETHIDQAVVGCGNLKLDKNMREYLKQKVTASSEKVSMLEQFLRRLFDYFVDEFKLSFSNEDSSNGGYIYNMDDAVNIGSIIQSEYLQDNSFIFPYEDMKKYIFDPVTNTILESIERAIQGFENGISGIFLSGTIGQDKYLHSLVEEKLGTSDVKVHSIRDRAFVVSKGLIYYGIRERGLMIPYIEKRDVKQKNKIRKPGNEKKSIPSTFDDTKKFNHKNIDYIIGLDFGTTYSGFAYAPVPKNDEERKKTHVQLIKEIKTWPKQNNMNYPKVPSLLYYNQKMEYSKKFGHEAKAEYAKRSANGLLLRHFKLLLSRDFNPDIDDKELKNLDDFDIVDAIANYLRDFSKEGISRMKRINLAVDEARLGFIVTLPAMWSDEAKNTMRAAVKKAGFVKFKNKSDDFDERVVFITEAEAASLYCEKFYEDGFNMNRQGRFMICDAGGGTVDLVTFEVKEYDISETKVISEITSGDGDNCGSVYLDERFRAYILKKFNANGGMYTIKGIENIVDQFIRDIKPNFEPSLNPDMEEAIRLEIPMSLNLPNDLDDETGFIQEDEIVIQYTEMESEVFKPVVDKVLNLIHQQLLKLPEGERQVDSILMVGGFGQSVYLHKKIKERFESKAVGTLSIEVLPDGYLAICRGAVSFGLEPRMVSEGITRYTYGLQVKDKFRIQDDPSQKMIGYDGTDYCQNVFTEIVARDTKISKGTVYILKTFVIYPNDPIFAIYSTDKKHDSDLRKLINTGNIQPICKLHAKIPEIPGINDGDKVMFDVVVEITGTNINVDIMHEGTLLTNEEVTKVNAIVPKRKYKLGSKGEKKKGRSIVSIFLRSNSNRNLG